MTRDAIIALARGIAQEHELEPALVLALIEQESGFDPWAVRYEPGFYQRYVAPQVNDLRLRDLTEARARAFSWGLMQVMGQVAREHGYEGPLPALCEPATGIDVGCRVFEACLREKGRDVRLALLRWNGGGRIAYADEVLERAEKWSAMG